MAEIIGAGAGVLSAMVAVYQLLMDKIEVSKDLEVICKNLDEAMQMLCAARDDREHIFKAHRSRKERTKTYSAWLGRVRKLEGEVNGMKVKYDRQKRKINMLKLSRSNLGGEMKTKSLEALSLYKEVLTDMLVERDPEPVLKMKAPNIKEVPTHQKYLESILRHLKDSRVKGIRVLGQFGVGKTAVMQNLNNHEDVAKMFELVIWVKVSNNSKNFSTREMQEDIVTRLKVDMEGKDNYTERIRDELEGKKCLLLLDGVNEDLDLEKIGIHPNDESGSKIVLTTRLNRVCHSMVNRVIEIERLSYDEARDMFQKVLGHSRTWRVMREVIEYCYGLPFLIQTVASAFKNRDTEESWDIGLSNLKYFPDKGDPSIQIVYKYLEFCCNELKGVQKDCFLYSAMFSEESDINTHCLLDCWAAEDLCGTNQARAYGRQILEELKTMSLLEEGLCGRGENVRMHKLIRKVALDKLLADDRRKHLVRTGALLQDPPKVEDWNQKDRIALVDNNLTVIPECPDSPFLFTLFLQKNRSLNQIHTIFFENMGNLRILNLQNTGIASLPSSLWKLKLLKVLYLNGCTRLLKLPFEIRELASLEVLDIRGTGVEIIHEPFPNSKIQFVSGFIQKVVFGEAHPHPWTPIPNIGSLPHLKRLLVSFNSFGNENISRHVLHFHNEISNIPPALEELVIDVNSYKKFCDKMINVVRNSVATMKNLTTLKFLFKDCVEEVIKVVAGTKRTYFPEAGDLASFLEKTNNFDSKLSFEVYIGCSISSHQIPEINQYQRYLKICNAKSCEPTTSVSEVLSRSDAFELVSHCELEHVSQLGTTSFDGVKGCLVEGCNKIVAIADGNCPMDGPMLPNLLELYMKKLPRLKSIWRGGPLKVGSLFSLRTLLIEDCFAIQELFTDSGIRVLPNLRKLMLVNLQNLTSICTNFPSDQWPALEELKIHGCPLLTGLPFEDKNAMKLRKLILLDMNNLTICANESVQWPALEKLKIHGCVSLSSLPLSKDSTINLRKLTLLDLPNLTTLCTAESLEWSALEKLKIQGCPSLTELPFKQGKALKLRSVQASQKWWEALKGLDSEVKQHLHQVYRSL
ncbi:hypothetical protein LguiB_006548 [Lonicera macranthoides]